MKLYEIVKHGVKPKIYAKISDGSSYVIIDHLDGLYSYGETEKGGVLHLSVNTPLKPKDDGYELKA